MTTDQPQASHRQPKVHHRIRNTFVTIGIAVLVMALFAAGVAIWLNSSLGNITSVVLDLPEKDRPAKTESTNILLLGVDVGSGNSRSDNMILRDAAKAEWPVGKYRSDTMMLVHVTKDRDKVYVISMPRDSYVPIIDGKGEQHGSAKINSALSLHGPAGATATVERLSGVRIDHIALTDFDRFERLTDAVGGVYLTEGNGERRLYDGEEALAYARERKALPNGDFDRVKRQQNFLRAVGERVLAKGVFTNPLELKRILDAITTNLAVDANWKKSEIRSFALSMRSVRPDDVSYLTLPTSGTADDPVAGSIVVVDQDRSAELFAAIQSETMDEWVEQNREELLGQFVW